MKLKTACPNCHASIAIKPEFVGKKAKCPSCSQPFIIETARSPSSEQSLEGTAEAALATVSSGSVDTQEPDSTSRHSANQKDSVTKSAAQIGRFQLRSRLGQGGFGSVYRAFDPVLDRETALKVPHRSVDVRRQFDRVLKEAKASARLRHPNIVAVFEVGESESQPYIASEFVKGRTLSEVLKESSDDPQADLKTRIEWLISLARGLAYAHREGIVHRDVKPQNVLIDEAGRAMLTDFGLALRQADENPDNRKNSIIGTPAYLSPEQALGDQSAVGPASDQYALGVILYEILTGQRPFQGNTWALISQILESPVPAPSTVAVGVSRELQCVCLKVLSKDPSSRYPSCDELADDLQRWINGDLVEATNPTIVHRLMHWARKRPQIAAWTVAAAALVLAGAGISIRFLFQQIRMANTLAAETVTLRHQNETATAEVAKANEAVTIEKLVTREVSSRADSQEYANKLAKVETAIAENRLMEAHDLLDRIPWQQRHIEHGLLRRRTLGTPFVFFHSKKGTAVRQLSFSHDSRILASAGDDGSVRFWDTAANTLISTVAIPGLVDMKFLRSGARLVTLQQLNEEATPSLSVWDLDQLKRGQTGAPVWTANITRFRPKARFSQSVAGDHLAIHPDRALVAVFGQVQESAAPVIQDAPAPAPAQSSRATDRRRSAPEWTFAAVSPHAAQAPPAIEDAPNPPELMAPAMPHVPAGVEIWDLDQPSQQTPVALAIQDSWIAAAAFSVDGSFLGCVSGKKDSNGQYAKYVVDVPSLQASKATVYSDWFQNPNQFRAAPPQPEQPASDGAQVANTPAAGASATPVSSRVRLHTQFSDAAVLTLQEQPLISASRQSYSPFQPHVSAEPARALELGDRGTFVVSKPGASGHKLEIRRPSAESESLAGHVRDVTDLAMRPDGKCFVSADTEGEIRIWPNSSRTPDGARYAQVDPNSPQNAIGQPLTNVACSADNRFAACAAPTNSSGQLPVWDPVSGEKLFDLPSHQNGIHAVDFHPEKSILVTVDGSRQVRLWNLEDRSLVREWNAGPTSVGVVRFSLTGQHLLTAAGPTLGVPQPVPANQQSPPDASQHDSGSHEICIWNPETGQETVRCQGHGGRVLTAVFSPNGQQVFSGSADGTLREWSVDNGSEIRQWTTNGQVPWQICSGGNLLAALLSEPCGGNSSIRSGDSIVRVFSLETRAPRYDLTGATGLQSITAESAHAAISPATVSQIASTVMAIDLSRDGRRLLLAGNDLAVHDAVNGAKLTAIPFDGLTLRSVQEQVSYTYTVNVPVQEQRQGIRTVGKTVCENVAVNKDVTFDESAVDIAKDEMTLPMHGLMGQQGVSIKSDDGKLPEGLRPGQICFIKKINPDKVVLFEDELLTRKIDLRRPGTGQVSYDTSTTISKQVIEQETYTYTVTVMKVVERAGTRTVCKTVYEPTENPFVVFSPDGSRILASEEPLGVRVFDGELPDAVLELTRKGNAESRPVTAVSPDGRHVAQAGRDPQSCFQCGTSAITVWDRETGEIRWTQRLTDEAIHAIAFDPTTSDLILVSRKGDGSVKLAPTGILGATPAFASAAVPAEPAPAPVPGAGHSSASSVPVVTSISVWNSTTGELLHTFSEPDGPVIAAATAKTQRLLATLSSDGTIRIRDLEKQSVIRTWRTDPPADNRVNSVTNDTPVIALNGDGTLVSVTWGQQPSRVFQTDAPEKSVALTLPFDTIADFSDDSAQLITSGSAEYSQVAVTTPAWNSTDLIASLTDRAAELKTAPQLVARRSDADGTSARAQNPRLENHPGELVLSRPQLSGVKASSMAWIGDNSIVAIPDQNPNGPVLLWDLERSAKSRPRFTLPVTP